MAAANEANDPPGDNRASAASQYVSGGLARLELGAAEAELAVIEAADSLYRPLIDRLLEAELDGVAPEPGGDMSRGPRNLEPR